jgi:hypothetical protein
VQGAPGVMIIVSARESAGITTLWRISQAL